MKVYLKKGETLEGIREACRIAATALGRLLQFIQVGMCTYDIDQEGKRILNELGAKSACFHYKMGDLSFPSHTCISVNEEVVHGIGRLSKVIQEGDLVSLDVVVNYKGFIGDNARSIILGEATIEAKNLLDCTKDALFSGIQQAREGNRVGDISNAIQVYCEKRGYSLVREFVGHGVGQKMHEEPQIPNFGKRNTGPRLKAGMVLAIEPMVNQGRPDIRFLEDGWTAVTIDKKLSAHFEHTVLVTKNDPEILTLPFS